MLSPSGHVYRMNTHPSGRNLLHFFTWSCEGRLALFTNDAIKDAIKDAFAGHLLAQSDARGPILDAWVVMPEHVHVLVAPRDDTKTRDLLAQLKGTFAHRVLARWRELDAPILARITRRGRSRFCPPGGGYDRGIVSREQREEKQQYIACNPVRRGLVATPSAWKWSHIGWPERSGDT
jgi:putative transposase